MLPAPILSLGTGRLGGLSCLAQQSCSVKGATAVISIAGETEARDSEEACPRSPNLERVVLIPGTVCLYFSPHTK